MFFVYLFLLPKEQIVTEFNYFSIGQEISILKSSFGLLGPSGGKQMSHYCWGNHSVTYKYQYHNFS